MYICYTHTHTHTHIYGERERERDGERERRGALEEGASWLFLIQTNLVAKTCTSGATSSQKRFFSNLSSQVGVGMLFKLCTKSHL
jgi:hypothetical protein